MFADHHSLDDLAAQARDGNAAAASELRRRLGESLGPIVRYALRGGPSPVADRVRAAARRAGADPTRAADAVRETLNARVIARLRGGAASARAYETVTV